MQETFFGIFFGICYQYHPGEVHFKSFPKFNHGERPIMMNFQNGHQMHQFALMYKLLFSSIAFYSDKLEYNNILQV